MEKLLCVGGPWAGEVVEVHDNMRYLRAPARKEASGQPSLKSGTDPRKGELDVVEYKRITLHEPNASYGLFFFPTDDEGPIEHLLDWYRDEHM